MNRLDSPRLPLLVQNVSSLHDLLTVGAEHALQGGQDRERSAFLKARTAEGKDKALLGPGIFPCMFPDDVSMSGSGLHFKTVDTNVNIKNKTLK